MRLLSELKKLIGNHVPPRIDYYRQVIRQKWVTERKHPEYKARREECFREKAKTDLKRIPLFIISYNRLSYLKSFVEQMEKCGIRNIYIIDNHSTYKPLLEYYDRIPYTVFRLDYNGGHKVFWEDERFSSFREDFYMVSDPDILLVEECADDFIQRLFDVLWKYPCVNKAGVSLKIDDVPSDSIFGKSVIEWEKQFFKFQIEKGLFYAPIDTTLALYVPDEFYIPKREGRAFRTGYPYQARHLPWYKTKNDITEEDLFYSQNQKNGWWNIGKGTMTKDIGY